MKYTEVDILYEPWLVAGDAELGVGLATALRGFPTLVEDPTALAKVRQKLA